MKKICLVATIPDVVHAFLQDHIRAAAKQWAVTVVSNPDHAELLAGMEMRFIPLVIRRKASPLRDLIALARMTALFRRQHFDLVHSIMPKTGLLAMLAAKLAGVPVRMHTFTGQVWVTRRGWKRVSLKMFDRMIVACATHVLVDSPSQRDFLVAEGVLKPGRGIVLGYGSICGVDVLRFHPDAWARSMVREELDIGMEQTVILFLGRLNRDKGVLDLATAFADIAARRPDAVLVLVGAEEDIPYARIQQLCGQYRDRLRRVGYTPEPQRYMAAADIFCLPSYREGFGQVIIEAAACAVPAVATRIYGISDAVEHGRTGLLSAPGDIAALTENLLKLIWDGALRQAMAEAARMRALDLYSSAKITAALTEAYEKAMTGRRT